MLLPRKDKKEGWQYAHAMQCAHAVRPRLAVLLRAHTRPQASQLSQRTQRPPRTPSPGVAVARTDTTTRRTRSQIVLHLSARPEHAGGRTAAPACFTRRVWTGEQSALPVSVFFCFLCPLPIPRWMHDETSPTWQRACVLCLVSCSSRFCLPFHDFHQLRTSARVAPLCP